ncbi:MAG: metallophosphoesterase family protein [Candidatus Cloacimonetes bacterium]|nr:metallophosphoesterase family protein [Candidatus Cloacimonadota bacterium]
MTEKIIVLSDSHRNQILLRQVLRQENSLTAVFHLGDTYEDLDENPDLTTGKNLTRVPGIFHPQYLDKTLPAVILKDILNWKILLVHCLKDVAGCLENSDLVLYGHTHNWEFHQEKGRYFLNPGHLKSYEDRGRKPSYAILLIEENQISVQIKDLKKNILFEHKIHRKAEEK